MRKDSLWKEGKGEVRHGNLRIILGDIEQARGRDV